MGLFRYRWNADVRQSRQIKSTHYIYLRGYLDSTVMNSGNKQPIGTFCEKFEIQTHFGLYKWFWSRNSRHLTDYMRLILRIVPLYRNAINSIVPKTPEATNTIARRISTAFIAINPILTSILLPPTLHDLVCKHTSTNRATDLVGSNRHCYIDLDMRCLSSGGPRIGTLLRSSHDSLPQAALLLAHLSHGTLHLSSLFFVPNSLSSASPA